MGISIVIPAHNSSATIEATLDSALNQTLTGGEILVLDDGSTDNTAALVARYQPRVTLIRQPNKGVAVSRNVLCQQAREDLIAFLDHDDIWHPRYLETQWRAFNKHPAAAAFFTDHLNFTDGLEYDWNETALSAATNHEVIESQRFIEHYNKCPGLFGSMSFCCISKAVLMKLGSKPFPAQLSGADDYYLFNVLPNWGPIVFTPIPLVAYRQNVSNQSADKLATTGLAVRAFELLAERGVARIWGSRSFNTAFASKRRNYAKYLMGAGQVREARKQVKATFARPGSASSLVKSVGFFQFTFMPEAFQPRWPNRYRE